nr:hypothetical protein [Photobacterium phosphoreum]
MHTLLTTTVAVSSQQIPMVPLSTRHTPEMPMEQCDPVATNLGIL